MGYLGRRIGLSQDSGDSNPGGAGGAVGGGILDLFAHGYFERQGDIYNDPGQVPAGLTATGGVISEYTDGPAVYRAHVFTSSGEFEVTEIGTFGGDVDLLLIGGGGGGGAGFHSYGPGSGGGAGGWVQVTTYTLAAATYPVTVGGGGAGGPSGSPNAGGGRPGTSGGDSVFTNPSPETITAKGGGGGGGTAPYSPTVGLDGGSGGGAGSSLDRSGGATNQAPSQPTSISSGTLTQYGYAGGASGVPSNAGTGAGGGAGGAGTDFSTPAGTNRAGGSGRASVYAYGPPNPVTYAAGGPANGPQPTVATDSTAGSGDGGMGSRANSPGTNNYFGGKGGSGVVVVRYKIAQVTGSAKASGGAVSFYGGKTIHVFTSSGTFANPTALNGGASNPLTVEYVLVGGGGGGGAWQHGAGGGAGGYRTGPLTVPSGSSYTVTVGGGGRGGFGPPGSGSTGIPGGFSRFGPTYVGAGGGGASYQQDGKVGQVSPAGSDGGSAGGAAYSPNSPIAGGPYGNPGGVAAASAPGYGSGGGGGAGAAGSDGSSTGGGAGGVGVQIPTTFRSPQLAPSDSTNPFTPERGGGLGTPGPAGSYYMAGGGGGSVYTNASPPSPAANAGAGGAGGGGAAYPGPGAGRPGIENTGGGGGATERDPDPNINNNGGNGGSGIVIIAYPT